MLRHISVSVRLTCICLPKIISKLTEKGRLTTGNHMDYRLVFCISYLRQHSFRRIYVISSWHESYCQRYHCSNWRCKLGFSKRHGLRYSMSYIRKLWYVCCRMQYSREIFVEAKTYYTILCFWVSAHVPD